MNVQSEKSGPVTTVIPGSGRFTGAGRENGRGLKWSCGRPSLLGVGAFTAEWSSAMTTKASI